jgi:hypothetical protein
MKTVDWLKTHKQEAALGAGGVVVAIALYVRSRSNAASGSSSSTAGYATPNSSSTYPAGYVDTSSTDLYNGLEGQIVGLQAAIQQASAAQQGGTTASATPPAAAVPSDLIPLGDQVLVGSGYSVAGGAGPGGGYGSGVVAGSGGNYFTPIGTLQGSEALFGSGSPVDYEPALGVFDPVTSQAQFNALEHPAGGGPGTTLFTPYKP